MKTTKDLQPSKNINTITLVENEIFYYFYTLRQITKMPVKHKTDMRSRKKLLRCYGNLLNPTNLRAKGLRYYDLT